MTMSRDSKAKIQTVASKVKGGAKVPTLSPKARDAHGPFWPKSKAVQVAVMLVRDTRTAGRTRASVIEDKLQARRGAGRRRAF